MCAFLRPPPQCMEHESICVCHLFFLTAQAGVVKGVRGGVSRPKTLVVIKSYFVIKMRDFIDNYLLLGGVSWMAILMIIKIVFCKN